MSLHIKIFSGTDALLDKIAEINYGQGLDALDHAGGKIRNAQRRAFRSSTTIIDQHYDRNGNLRIRRSTGKNQYGLGKRISHRNKGSMENPSSMESFITSNLMPNSMTMVVGGKHKKLRPKFRKDGKIVGDTNPVGAVTKYSYAILQKLNSGDASDSDYKKIYRSKAEERIFKNMRFRKQHFMEKGYNSVRGDVKNIMTDKLESMIHKQINRVEVKLKEVRTS